jgi:hypothetical protein
VLAHLKQKTPSKEQTSMIDVALAEINSFASSPANEFVPPSKEPIFVLTGSQLQEIITKATKPILDRLDALQEVIALERAYDRQRIAKLEQSKPQPLQRDRREILKALLVANGGKMLAKDARQRMRISKKTFSLLLDTAKDFIETKPYHLDKRQLVLIIK